MPKAIKSLGQNFLLNKEIVFKMVDLLQISPNYSVIEIGPGPGTFTGKIVQNLGESNNFYAIEIDKRFVNELSQRYFKKQNIHIINDNFLDWVKNNNIIGNTVILGSIPYYITSPIIHSIIKMINKPKIVVLMVQKEVGQKICEYKVNPNYFSTFIKTFYDIKYVQTVLKNNFTPIPKVDSAVVIMSLKKDFYGITDNKINKYQKFLHLGFKNQKKMLNKVFELDLLKKVSLTGNERPHNLSVKIWVDLFNFYTDLNEI